MRVLPYIALSLSLVLLLQPTYNFASAIKSRSSITVDDVPTEVRPGSQVMLTGRVTDSNGNAVVNGTVTVYLLTAKPTLVAVASGVTDSHGMYNITWDVKMLPSEKPFGDVTKKLIDQRQSLFVQFEGNENLESSKTPKFTVTIKANTLNTNIATDKKIYKEGESAVVVITFIDDDKIFTDPTSIHATYNGEQVGDKLEKRKEGTFVFTTPPLVKGHNQVLVLPSKEGYNADTRVITITVQIEGSLGKFEGFP